MKIIKTISILLAFSISLLSCSTGSGNSKVIESNFPLKRSMTFPSADVIEKIAVSDTWIAICTSEKITAIDIEAGKTLWTVDFSISESDFPELKIINNTLIASSRDEIIMINKSGQKKEVSLSPKEGHITRLVATYPGYVYIIRGSSWRLEAYDTSQNTLLWKVNVGRGGTDVFYDVTQNISYVTTRDYSIQAVNNTTGQVLWKQDKSALYSAFEADVLYMVESTSKENAFRFSAFDVEKKQVLWETVIEHLREVYQLTLIGQRLIASGTRGLIAIDRSNGNQLWRTDVGETFYTKPVEFDNLIYAKGPSLKVYAISPNNGVVIGFVQLEKASFPLQPGYETEGEIHMLKDGIVFNTRNTVDIYKIK